MKNKVIAQIKSTSFIGWQTRELIWTISLITASIIAPAMLAHTPANQWITGTIVNLILFSAAYRLPLANAFMVAIFPSSVALLRGLLPAPMAMMIPYIIFSNITLITTFYFTKKNPLGGIIGASLVKFFILYASTLFLANALNSKLVFMFSWPQLATALAGGVIFAGILKIVNKKSK
ncbi:MAG: hypothetical protein R6V40_04110 [Candidatus Moraniibacteriota bacterium]